MIIGVIAEENNDVEVLYELTRKLTDDHAFSFKKFVGHGCGALRRKCRAWAVNLLRRGSTHLVVLHDLDMNDENQLRSELEHCVQDIGFEGYVILIPIREIEAWLLGDARALKSVFNMSKMPKVPTNPEAIERPKEKLRDIVWKAASKRYVNTIHNSRIAAACRISRLLVCKSFRPYPKFIAAHSGS
jgi:hypothetical protein